MISLVYALFLYNHAVIDDLDEITDYLLHLGQDDIYYLGLAFGLNHLHLKKMREDSGTFREDVIVAWLQKEDQVLTKGKPTWETLVKALRRPKVNKTEVAMKIEKEKLNFTQT